MLNRQIGVTNTYPNNIEHFTNYKIVVARYNENIDWLYPLKENIIIYNKGNSLQSQYWNTTMTPTTTNNPTTTSNLITNVNYFEVTNMGRETETYLRYIIDNYHNLPDVICFTQGNIKDHRKGDPLIIIKNYIQEAFEQGYSNPSSNDISKHPQKGWLVKNWDRRPGGKHVFSSRPKMKFKNSNKITWWDDWFTEHIKKDYPKTFAVYLNGIFAVSRQKILNRPKSFYKNMILEVNHHVNPIEGHYFERAWYYIFN